jgi:peptidoglycan-N-acetylglucosamine deacetylase
MPPPRSVTFTLDLEDVRTSPTQPDRVPEVTERIFDRVREIGVRGTLFVVGEVADAHPGLVAKAVADGHEVALHAHRHVGIDNMGGPEAMRKGTADAKARLEDLVGAAVLGYRAPMMSLVASTAWAVDVLGELGFTYSSSVLPARNPLYGWPGMPTVPFRWHNGLVELPCPVVTVARSTVPYLGGTYMRVFPDIVRRTGLRRAPEGAALWTYCHPWEFDHGAPLVRQDQASWPVSLVGRINRRRMMDRVERAVGASKETPDDPRLAITPGPPLAEVVAALAVDRLPVIDARTGTPPP